MQLVQSRRLIPVEWQCHLNQNFALFYVYTQTHVYNAYHQQTIAIQYAATVIALKEVENIVNYTNLIDKKSDRYIW